MSFDTVTLRCDRCGKRETHLGEPVTWGTYTVIVQGPPGTEPRREMGHACPDCLLVDRFVPEPARLAVASLNGFPPHG